MKAFKPVQVPNLFQTDRGSLARIFQETASPPHDSLVVELANRGLLDYSVRNAQVAGIRVRGSLLDPYQPGTAALGQ